jgi:hypothetical protein
MGVQSAKGLPASAALPNVPLASIVRLKPASEALVRHLFVNHGTTANAAADERITIPRCA